MKGALVLALLRVAALLPRRLAQAIGALVGLLNYHGNSRAARVTRANLQLCLPQGSDRELLTRRSLIATGKTMLETPAVWLGDSQRLQGWIAGVRGEDLLKARLAAKEGLLILLPHFGNWELFNVFFRRYGRMTALYQPPRQPWMKDVMARVRNRHGNRMMPTTRRGLASLFKTLRAGGTVVVLPDQVPVTGVFAPFFNEAALTDTLSFRLIHRTGARVLGAVLVRNAAGCFDVRLLEPGPDIYSTTPEASLSAVNELVERCAMLDPAQYQWEYKRFRERPAGQAKIYRFRKPPGVH